MKNSIFILGFAFLAACSGSGIKYETNELGLKYHFFEKGDGAKGNVGDYYDLNVEFRKMDDSVFVNTQTQFRLNADVVEGGLPYSIANMAKGDSAVFVLKIDSVYKDFAYQPPHFLAGEDEMKIHVRVTDILDEYAFNLRMIEEEEKKIEAFVDKNGWAVVHDTATDIRYEITTSNPDGTQVEYGDEVGITYYYYTLEGQPIARIKEGDLRQIVVGEKSSIPGWSRVLSFCRELESVRAIIPFEQAFGAQGFAANVPPFATIILEADVVVVNKNVGEKIDLLD